MNTQNADRIASVVRVELDRHQYKAFNELIGTYRAKGYNLPTWIGLNKTTIPGVVSINSGTSLNLSLDCSKSASRTLMEKMAIDQALDFIRFARDEKIPSMGKVCLMRTGGFAMARDTRRLVGEYVFNNDAGPLWRQEHGQHDLNRAGRRRSSRTLGAQRNHAAEPRLPPHPGTTEQHGRVSVKQTR